MVDQDAVARQRTLIAALAAALGPATQIFETHISWVLVAGDTAYKFKKAVRFDFLDFSTLQARRHYCDEELRLNGKLAPGIYQEVVAVTGTDQRPVVGGGPAIEYAVKMRAFPQEALWSHRIEAGLLDLDDMDGLATTLARFHADTAAAPPDAPWCTPQALQAIADETLDDIDRLLDQESRRATAVALREWEYRQRAVLREAFLARRTQGRIRECHGDLHCGNILTIDHRVEAFDCIEFNDRLRWIDVMNDIAFACMDLRFRQRADLAASFLNRYLELSGDYEGLRVLRYYEVHRALIRCKVALLRRVQCEPGSAAAQEALREALAYLDFADARATADAPAILLMHGFSGSGKSTVARKLVASFDAVRLRSDVERKRMHGIPASAHDAAGSALYHADVTQQTYARLLALSRIVVESGGRVIADATFLRQSQRQPFMELARELGVPFAIVDVQASDATMRARILKRQHAGDDPSDAGLSVLEHQLREHDPLTQDELRHVVTVNTEHAPAAGSALAALRTLPGFQRQALTETPSPAPSRAR
ncbi:MAG TPA: AAA family ATPase [Noviherbaspirillum sp.]